MDDRIEAVLAEFHARAALEAEVMEGLPAEELGRRRDEFLLGVGPATGALLNLLAREAGARAILELGTSFGYSTIWLADAARAGAGRVVSIELSGAKLAAAADAVARAGLADHVEFRRGDALQLLARAEETYDFVLLDLWKDVYAACLDALVPRLAPGAILVADNMLSPPSVALDALRYRKRVAATPGMESVLLPVGSGLYLSRYRAR